VCIALHNINKKGIEIEERQNRCHYDIDLSLTDGASDQTKSSV